MKGFGRSAGFLALAASHLALEAGEGPRRREKQRG